MAVPIVEQSPQRWERALARAISDGLDVLVCVATGAAFVESASRPGELYAVSTDSCTCKAGQQGVPCKHVACYRAQVGLLSLPVAPADCPSCTGCGVVAYRSFEERCPDCQGTGVRVDKRLTGAPAVEIVATAA